MAETKVKTPDGDVITVRHPEGVSQSEIIAYAKKNYQPKAQPKPAPPVEELREMGKVDPMGMVSAIAAGGNRGAFNLVDLPFDIINMGLDALGVPESIRTARPTEAFDLAIKSLTGQQRGPIEFLTTPTQAVDTPQERILSRASEFASETVFGGPLARAAGIPTNTAKEFVPAVAAGAAFGASEEVTDSPWLQLAAATVGGLAPSAVSATGRQVADMAQTFTKSGAEKRVGSLFVDAAEEPAVAIANLQTNPFVIKEVIPGTSVDSRMAVNDPGVERAINSAISSNDRLITILDEGSEKAVQAVEEQLLNLASRGSPSTFIRQAQVNLSDVVNNARASLNSQLNAVSDSITKIETDFASGSLPSETSRRFTEALRNSYDNAKQVERSLWREVDYTEDLNIKDLVKSVNSLKRQLKNTGTAGTDFPDSVFNFVNQFKQKKGKKHKGPKGFEGLQGWRSSVLDAKRAAQAAGNNGVARALGKLDDLLVDEFFYADGGNPAHAAAAEYTRTLHTAYNSGKIGKYLKRDTQGANRVDEEVVLDRIINQGANIGDVRRAIDLENNRTLKSGIEFPAATGLTERIEEYVKNKLISIPADKRQAFVNRHKDLLKAMPTLARDIKRLDDVIQEQAQRIALAEGRLKTVEDVNKAKIAALTGADPRNIYGRLRKLSNKDLIGLREIARSENALSGLQSVFIREITNKMVSRGMTPQAFGKILSGDNTLNFAFENILSNEQRTALKKLDNTLKSVQTTAKKSGDDVAALYKANPMVQIIARMLGVRVAGVAAPSGPGSIQTAGILSQAAQKLANQLPSSKAAAVVEKAVLDPNYMAKLMQTSLDGITNVNDAEKMLRLWFQQAGVESLEEEDNAL